MRIIAYCIIVSVMVLPVSQANDPLLDLLTNRSNNKGAVLEQFNDVPAKEPNDASDASDAGDTSDGAPAFRPLQPELPTKKERLDSLGNPIIGAPTSPITRLALLLPTNSRGLVSAAAHNFHEGCLNGLRANDIPIRVDLYETDDNPSSVVDSYKQAIANESAFVIGPLRKKDVLALVANFPIAPIQTLVLQPTTASNYYVLTMDIEKEIAQLAQLIQQQNYRVMVVSDAGSTSRNLKRAFEQAWNKASHLPVSHFYIYDREKDWKKLFEQTKTLGTASDEEEGVAPVYPLAIFAAGDGKFVESVRNFIPQRLPVFASSIYIGKSNSSFVDNLWVMEMPWFLTDHTDSNDALISTRPAIHQRFYAMGADACRIALDAYLWGDGWEFNGFSGYLTLQDNQFFRRGKIVQYQAGALQRLVQ